MSNIYDEIPETNVRYVVDTKTLDDIMEEQYITGTYIIEDFLHNGTYIFAGAPKVGKSFMALELAYHVSKGIPLWGKKVNQCEVLYLALEDTYSRIQKRAVKMFGTEEENNALHIAVNAGNFADGNIIVQLEHFVFMHKATRLIIIDTLQKIREVQNDYSYSRDYDVISAIKSFADSYGVCVLLIHHTRKMNDDDKFLTISGTNGLLGAADGAFIMYKHKRLENDAVIEVSSRDIGDEKITVTRNPDNMRWELKETTATNTPVIINDIVKAVGEFIVQIPQPSWKGTATELIEDLGAEGQITPNHLTRTLNTYVNELYENYKVCYCSYKKNSVRYVHFVYDGEKK